MTEPTTDPCACGARYCGNRNRGHFHRLPRPHPKIRAAVFVWPTRRFWTWCPIVNGEPVDQGSVMGHYDSLQAAWADADAWARASYGEPR